MITFLEISPNTVDCDLLYESLMKIITKQPFSMYNDDHTEIIEPIKKYITVHSHYCPNIIIHQKFNNRSTIKPFAISDNLEYYYCIIFDDLLNNTQHVQLDTGNSIVSSLVSYVFKNHAIFGPVFVVGISKLYYDKNIATDTPYCNFKINDFVDNIINAKFVRVFTKCTGPIYYLRDILDNYIQHNQSLIKYLDNDFVNITYKDVLIIAKKKDPLPENVLNFYLVNITDDDIKVINS